MSKLLVLDASVLLQWTLKSPGENDAASAAKLLASRTNGDIDILLPALWAYEVANVAS